jgi:4-hydroxy-3-polyprenylbenzoate decarboxylase
VPAADLRSWIDELCRAGELVEIEAEVDPYLEVTEIVDRTVKSGGPALLFKNLKGAEHRLLANQFGTERRMAMAFGELSLDAVGQKLGDVLEMQPPQGIVEKVKGLGKLKRLADSMPKTVRSGPVQDAVLEPDLDLLPIQHCWPGDPAPFITLPAVITRDPRTGTRNVGMYRMQKIDSRTTFMHWQIHKDGAADWRGMGDRLDVAVALGCDPVTTYSASAPLPKHIDEFMLAGFLRGEAVELVPAKTVDLEVPANAEIVLEGYIEKGELGTEGPFGDHTGYYSPPEPFPVFHLTCMTMRRDAWLGKATERIFLPAIKMTVPEIVDYDLPVAGAFHNCVIVSIRKGFPGHAKKVMHAIWGLGMLSLSKSVVVVDEFVDVHDYEQVFFHACANVDPGRDLVISEGPTDQLDHAASMYCYGGKVGIDATHKWESEGAREWPERIEMSQEVRDLVDRRWSEYGLAPPEAQNGGISRVLRQTVRR